MDKKPSSKADIRKDILGEIDSIFEEIEPDMTIEYLPKEQTPTPRMIWTGVPID